LLAPTGWTTYMVEDRHLTDLFQLVSYRWAATLPAYRRWSACLHSPERMGSTGSTQPPLFACPTSPTIKRISTTVLPSATSSYYTIPARDSMTSAQYIHHLSAEAVEVRPPYPFLQQQLQYSLLSLPGVKNQRQVVLDCYLGDRSID